MEKSISFSARHFLILARQSCTLTYFVRQSVLLWSLESRFVFAEESCQFGVIYKRKRHRMFLYYISSNSLCGSVVNKMATLNLIYECNIVVLTS